jgi:hypothetical protein
MCKKETYIVNVAIMMAIAAVMLFPVIGIAGSLEPAAAPAPTMKTLDQMPPTWGQKLQCDVTACPRFELVMGGVAVLDKETGLVWEQSPAYTPVAGLDWLSAISHCTQLILGGRQGWRLPTIEELASIVDRSVLGQPSIPRLPVGHPFDTDCSTGGCVAAGHMWSATTYAGDTTFAWQVDFSDSGGSTSGHNKSSTDIRVWCVRGGQGYDGY